VTNLTGALVNFSLNRRALELLESTAITYQELRQLTALSEVSEDVRYEAVVKAVPLANSTEELKALEVGLTSLIFDSALRKSYFASKNRIKFENSRAGRCRKSL
jgi:hypothetical protein